MKGWSETTLKKVAKKIDYGYTASATETNTGVKFLRITDIVPSSIEWDTVPFCEISQKDLEKSFLSQDDIVIARTGATVGYAKQIGLNPPQAVFASYLVRVILKDDVTKKFVGLLVESNNYKNYINTIAGGSAQPNANAKDLSSYPFYLPPKPIQKKIAAVLSAYDDLIENNKHRIASLEKMAEEIYREWFVRMRFPGHNNTKFVKGVPTTWKIRELKSLVEDIIDYRGLTPEKLGGHWAEEGIIALSALNVKAGELIRLDDSKRVLEVLYERWMRKRLQVHDILLTSEAPLGQVYFLVDSEQYVLSQRLFAIRANPAEVTPLYLYQYLRYPIGQGQLQARVTGSTVGGIRQTLLKRVEVIVPTDTLMKKHQECVLPIKKEIHALWKQNHVLAQTRDRLLPRLISGKLSVANLDIQFPLSMQDEAAI